MGVQESEERQGRRDPYDDGGFPEYTQPLDDRHIRGSTNSDLKLPPDSDADSIQDYVDGEQAGSVAGMNEDGSFIGQYRTLERQNRMQQQKQIMSSGFHEFAQ